MGAAKQNHVCVWLCVCGCVWIYVIVFCVVRMLEQGKKRGGTFFSVEFLSGSAMKPCAMMSAQLLPNNNRCSKGIKHIKRNTQEKSPKHRWGFTASNSAALEMFSRRDHFGDGRL